MSVLLETSLGDIVIDLECSKAPSNANNFLKLCQVKHFNNSLFSQVDRDYIAEITTKSPATI